MYYDKLNQYITPIPNLFENKIFTANKVSGNLKIICWVCKQYYIQREYGNNKWRWKFNYSFIFGISPFWHWFNFSRTDDRTNSKFILPNKPVSPSIRKYKSLHYICIIHFAFDSYGNVLLTSIVNGPLIVNQLLASDVDRTLLGFRIFFKVFILVLGKISTKQIFHYRL